MNLKEIIQELADKGEKVYCVPATVIAVNGKLCDVSPINGDADILDVQLQGNDETNGILITPTIGSVVIVAMTSKCIGVVVSYSQVDSIYFHGNQYGGLVKVDELKTQLTVVTTFLQGLKAAISAAPVSIGDGGASFKAALIASLSTLNFPDYSNIENTNVKHG